MISTGIHLAVFMGIVALISYGALEAWLWVVR
jgi:hypothetical protein